MTHTDRGYILVELKEFRTECYYDNQGHPISFGLFVNEEHKGTWIDVVDCYRQYSKYYKKKKEIESELA